MKYLKTFESHSNDTLIIVDVQKSYHKYFTEIYLNELKKYCLNFQDVYQIFDNHVDGKNVDKDYLYKDNPKIPVNGDLYTFHNQKDLIEKRYNYDVDSDFYKRILDKETYDIISKKEQNDDLKKGEIYPTKEGTHIIFIGNNHKWFHIGKKLYRILKSLSGKEVTIVGGADSECLEDVFTCCETLGVKIKRDWNYIWTSSSCPSQFYTESVNWNIINAKGQQRIFKPAFGNKSENTEFYQVLDSDGKVLSEIEVDMKTPEILSLLSIVKNSGVGSYLLDFIKQELKKRGFDFVKVWATKGSRPFWIKMGAEQSDSDDIYRLEIKL